LSIHSSWPPISSDCTVPPVIVTVPVLPLFGGGSGELEMDSQERLAYRHGRKLAMTPLANFHLPLPPDLREMLHEEAERSGQPATAVAREALQSWLSQRRRQRLHDEIAAWATEHAGTDLDLDKDLEQAGLDALAIGSS